MPKKSLSLTWRVNLVGEVEMLVVPNRMIVVGLQLLRSSSGAALMQHARPTTRSGVLRLVLPVITQNELRLALRLLQPWPPLRRHYAWPTRTC